jgi:hypothetical protein
VKPTIFLDLDGVLADFVGGARKRHRCDAPVTRWDFFGDWNLTPEQFWMPLADAEFWAGLDKTPECDAVVRLAEQHFGDRVAILSSPAKTPGCDDGKRAWVAKHLPGYVDRTFLGTAKHLVAHTRAVLLDDSDDNCRRFADAGGQYLLMPRPWNANRDVCDDLDTAAALDVAMGVLKELMS